MTERKMKISNKQLPALFLLIMISGIILWVGLASLDFGVHAMGKVSSVVSKIDIQAPYSAKVLQLNVVEGQLVKKDELIFKLEDQDVVSQIKQLSVQSVILEKRILATRSLVDEGLMAPDQLDEQKLRLTSVLKERELLEYKLSLSQIKSPIDGQVINLKINSVNEMVNPGNVLLQVIPSVKDLLIDVDIPVSEIESVKLNAPVEIKFITMPSKSSPIVDGILVSYASNQTINDKSGDAVYHGRVLISGGLKEQLGLEPILGMPVMVLIKGGTRSVLSYIVEPIKLLMSRSMRDE